MNVCWLISTVVAGHTRAATLCRNEVFGDMQTKLHAYPFARTGPRQPPRRRKQGPVERRGLLVRNLHTMDHRGLFFDWRFCSR